MSKIALSGNASGTGVFTFASPNSNTDRTLTLPDATGTILTSGSALIYSATTLSSYKWSSWNPSNVAGAATNAPSTGTTYDSDFVTMVNSSGTLTITFDIAGKYFICATQQTIHSAIYTYDRLILTLGGTATRAIDINPNNSGDSVNDLNFAISTGFYVSATAGQTLTILPTYELLGGGTTAQHVAYCYVTTQYCGG